MDPDPFGFPQNFFQWETFRLISTFDFRGKAWSSTESRLRAFGGLFFRQPFGGFRQVFFKRQRFTLMPNSNICFEKHIIESEFDLIMHLKHGRYPTAYLGTAFLCLLAAEMGVCCIAAVLTSFSFRRARSWRYWIILSQNSILCFISLQTYSKACSSVKTSLPCEVWIDTFIPGQGSRNKLPLLRLLWRAPCEASPNKQTS